MQVDIYIREKSGKREIRIPILPEQIKTKSGEATFATFDIMKKGEVAIPTGADLSSVNWESEFPGAQRKGDPLIRGSWKDPKTYNSTIESWKTNGTKLNLIVLGYPINKDVYISEYASTAAGAFGDLAYEITFVEARDITIKTSKVAKKTTTTSKKTTTTKRPATQDKTYTIKKGDTLWGISRKFYGTGTKWKTIYNANKNIIEKTAKKYGRSSSQNGHWIYPGVKLTIPNAK